MRATSRSCSARRASSAKVSARRFTIAARSGASFGVVLSNFSRRVSSCINSARSAASVGVRSSGGGRKSCVGARGFGSLTLVASGFARARGAASTQPLMPGLRPGPQFFFDSPWLKAAPLDNMATPSTAQATAREMAIMDRKTRRLASPWVTSRARRRLPAFGFSRSAHEIYDDDRGAAPQAQSGSVGADA